MVQRKKENVDPRYSGNLLFSSSFLAVHRTLIDACRTIVVWLVDLFIHYVFTEVIPYTHNVYFMCSEHSKTGNILRCSCKNCDTQLGSEMLTA